MPKNMIDYHLMRLSRIRLNVMDLTAATLCIENNKSIIVFELEADNILKVVDGKKIGTMLIP